MSERQLPWHVRPPEDPEAWGAPFLEAVADVEEYLTEFEG